MKIFADKKRIERLILKERDKIYLLRQNIKIVQSSNKLDYTKLGPFQVKRVKNKMNYELDLPKKMRIFLIFYISLLEPANLNTLIQTNLSGIDPEFQIKELEVKVIRKKRQKGQKVEYLIKWLGYEEEENTWESTTNLNCQDLMSEFKRDQKKKRNQPQAETQ